MTKIIMPATSGTPVPPLHRVGGREAALLIVRVVELRTEDREKKGAKTSHPGAANGPDAETTLDQRQASTGIHSGSVGLVVGSRVGTVRCGSVFRPGPHERGGELAPSLQSED